MDRQHFISYSGKFPREKIFEVVFIKNIHKFVWLNYCLVVYNISSILYSSWKTLRHGSLSYHKEPHNSYKANDVKSVKL